jgi:transposase
VPITSNLASKTGQNFRNQSGQNFRNPHLLASWRWREVVEALQALRGVSLIVAVTVVAEVGDLTRFTPRALMAFLGLVPSEHSSGERRRQGAITTTGNAHVRRVLAEAAHAYRATPAPVVRTAARPASAAAAC